jgi:mycoredoxin-dependent peroxiredoxin
MTNKEQTTMTLNVGDTAPDFTLKDTDGNEVTLSSFRGAQSVTVVFIPFAFSGICTGELCGIQDNLASFNDASNQVIAISCDRSQSLKAWKEQEGFDFLLLSDGWPHGEVARAYDCFNETAGCAERLTVVVDKDGTVAQTFRSGGIGEGRPLDQFTAALGAV